MRHFLLCGVLYLAARVGLCAGCFELCQVGFELCCAVGNVGFCVGFNVLLLEEHFCFEGGQVVVACFIVNAGDDVRSEVDDALEFLGSKVEQVAEA